MARPLDLFDVAQMDKVPEQEVLKPRDRKSVSYMAKALLNQLHTGPKTGRDLEKLTPRHAELVKELQEAGYPVRADAREGSLVVYQLVPKAKEEAAA